uniref:Immunoglobulin domain-containing protein n=1 Tax=Cyprinus carpio TaxID=7962 RepID=A0A8C1PCI6_CYPCA
MYSDAAFLCLWILITNGVFDVKTDEVKSVSVLEGDSVSLNTDVKVQRDDQIRWTFGPQNTRIAEIIKRDQINFIFVSNDGRFRDKLQMDNQTGSLTIRNIRSEHTGLYKLLIIISGKTSLKSFSVTVYAALPSPVITSNSSNCSSSSSSSVSRCVLLCSAVNSLSTSGGGISGEKHLQLCDQQSHQKPDHTSQHHSTLSHVCRTHAAVTVGGIISYSDSSALGCSCGGDILVPQEMQTSKTRRQVLLFSSNIMRILIPNQDFKRCATISVFKHLLRLI